VLAALAALSLNAAHANPALVQRPEPRFRVALLTGLSGHRQGIGLRYEFGKAFSMATVLDPFRFRVGYVSHTGAEFHPWSVDLGGVGWVEPVLGVGGYATGGLRYIHADAISGSGLWGGVSFRVTGPRGRTATVIGATAREQLNGNAAIDDLAVNIGFELGLSKRTHR
jgi:hypothetical protein